MSWYFELINPYVNGELNPLRKNLVPDNSEEIEKEIILSIENGSFQNEIFEKSLKWNFYIEHFNEVRIHLKSRIKEELEIEETVENKKARFSDLFKEMFFFHDLIVMDFRHCRECISNKIIGRTFTLNKRILFEIIKINQVLPFSFIHTQRNLLGNNLQSILSLVISKTKLTQEIEKHNSKEIGIYTETIPNIYSDVIPNHDKLSFRMTKIYRKWIREIYNFRLTGTSFIDVDSVTEEEFISVFTSEDVKSLGISISISCQTRQAAYIFEKIRLMCNNFFFRTIGESQIFRSKTGNLLQENNLSKSLNEKGKIKDKEEIDSFFNQFL